MDNDEQIMALQIKVAHLEQLCEDINGVVTQQADMIEYLKAKLNLVTGKIETLAAQSQDEGGEGLSHMERLAQEKPPHH